MIFVGNNANVGGPTASSYWNGVGTGYGQTNGQALQPSQGYTQTNGYNGHQVSLTSL